MLSPHFSSDELRCKHCGVCEVTDELVGHLELLRAIIGRPLPIVSGYRCPVHNRRVGGGRRSQHLLGKAADIPRGLVNVTQARRAGFVGLGVSGVSVVHVDRRSGPDALWRY